MGQKVNPVSFRMGMSQSWKSKWFSDKNYVKYLKQDVLVRKYLKIKLRDAGISRIEIKRSADDITIVIYSSRPGIIIGRGGTGIEEVNISSDNGGGSDTTDATGYYEIVVP